MGMLASESQWLPSKRQALVSGVVCVGIVLALVSTSEGKSRIIGGAHQAANFKALNTILCCLLALIALPFTVYTTTIHSSPTDKILDDLSYSVYLIQWPISIVYGNLYGGIPMTQRLPYFSVFCIITGVVALLAWQFIDKPVMEIRVRYLRRVITVHP